MLPFAAAIVIVVPLMLWIVPLAVLNGTGDGQAVAEVVDEVDELDEDMKGMLQPATSTASRTSRIELPNIRLSSWYVRIGIFLLYFI